MLNRHILASRGRYSGGLGHDCEEKGNMRRAVGVLLIAVLLTACGESSPPAGGGGGGGGGGPAEVPPLSVAWFGTSVDATSFGIVGRFTSAKQGSPIFVVGHLFPAHDAADLSVAISIGGSVQKTVTLLPGAGENGAILSADLSGASLGPGVYIVSFVDPKGTIFASGNLTVTAP